MSSNEPAPNGPDAVDEGRRDFIHLLAGGTAAAAAVGMVIPLIGQMMPAADVRALATKEVDISPIEPGQAIKALWQGKPVFLRRLTSAELDEAAETQLSDLRDKKSRNEMMPGDADMANRTIKDDFAIYVGICTHLGCVPLGNAEGEPKGEYGGWFCPCHGSHYDMLGRIRKGPAPRNLDVPPMEFISDTTVRLG